MTGGGNPFYEKIGYGKGIHWYCWKRELGEFIVKMENNISLA